MDSNLEKTLRKRADNNECIICGKDLEKDKQPITVLTHAVIGEVLICEKHIKSKVQKK